MIIEDLVTWALKHLNYLNYTVAHTFSDEVISTRMPMYSSAFLRNFRKVTLDYNNYQAFSLDIKTRSWIIALGEY